MNTADINSDLDWWLVVCFIYQLLLYTCRSNMRSAGMSARFLILGIRSSQVVTFTNQLLYCQEKSFWYLPNSKLCGRQNSSRSLGEGNNALHHPEVEALFDSISDCTLFNIPDTLPWFHLHCLCDPSLLPSIFAVPLRVSTQTRICLKGCQKP